MMYPSNEPPPLGASWSEFLRDLDQIIKRCKAEAPQHKDVLGDDTHIYYAQIAMERLGANPQMEGKVFICSPKNIAHGARALRFASGEPYGMCGLEGWDHIKANYIKKANIDTTNGHWEDIPAPSVDHFRSNLNVEPHLGIINQIEAELRGKILENSTPRAYRSPGSLRL